MKKLVFFCLFLILSACNLSTNKKQQVNSKFSEISYSAGACFGTCPVYTITINGQKHTAVFEAKHFNFSDELHDHEGNFSTTIDDEHYDELLTLLEKADPKQLQNYYANKQITDLATAYLTLRYKDGTIKKIKDYGKEGTPELIEIYQFFDELRTNQKWTSTQDPK